MTLYHQASFLKSASHINQLPPDEGYEVAFAGRSNAGKSSTLNVLTQNKKLARTSKTPGRTQLINLFTLDDERRLVDLPGYGYASVPNAVKARWQATVNDYLIERQALCGIVLLVDCRHPLKSVDEHMIGWAIESEMPLHILLSKCDKLSRNAGMKSLQPLERRLAPYPFISCQLFSALKEQGLNTLIKTLNQWYNL